jgi:hypothetical protein
MVAATSGGIAALDGLIGQRGTELADAREGRHAKVGRCLRP